MSDREVGIVRSESWEKGEREIDEINQILQDTIDSLIPSNERILNVQVVEERGLLRFWIYTIKEN